MPTTKFYSYKVRMKTTIKSALILILREKTSVKSALKLTSRKVIWLFKNLCT